MLLQTTAQVVSGALKTILTANLKRMLTTEIHTRVVNQSYAELLETNRQLALSEKKYRELAENLEALVQERTAALKRTYAKLVQQEKMASIGQLAAGIAHEINNPLGFILSNLQTLQKYTGRFAEMLRFFRAQVEKGAAAVLRPAAAEKWRSLKLDLLLADLPELFEQSIGGADRVRRIVADLRGFSHVDDAEETAVDINAEIDRTLSVLAHEIPPDTRIVREYGPLPAIAGRPALLCQAFLNIVRNALQARAEGLVLSIRSEFTDGSARLIFADNGPGIARDLQSRIFDPFFTTRETGQGLGLGLTVVYDVVTGCGGTIEVESAPGRGASFILQLPAGR
jgi:signal transduction histidine kinase